MHLHQFNFEILHIPGKDLVTADLLLRKLITKPSHQETELTKDLEYASINVVKTIPIRPRLMDKIKREQEKSHVSRAIHQYIIQGWQKRIPNKITEYRKYETSWRKPRLDATSSQSKYACSPPRKPYGLQKTYKLAQTGIWWPGMYKDIKNIVQLCTYCAEKQKKIQKNRWEKVAGHPT